MRTSDRPSTSPGGGAVPLAQSDPRAGRYGPGTAPPVPQQRLPVPRRERKPALAALAVLLILAGALASALLVIRSGDRISVIQIAKPVAPGQRIPLSAMRETQVADTGVETVPWDQRTQVARYYAKVGLVPGTLLIPSMVSDRSILGPGRVVVGLALKPGQLPGEGVTRGDHVRAYAVGGESDSGVTPGAVLADDAIVYDTVSDSTDISSGVTRVSVVVDADDATALTRAASAGAVAVALLPPGAEGSPTAPSQQSSQGPSQRPSQGSAQGQGDAGTGQQAGSAGAPPEPAGEPGAGRTGHR